MISDEKDKYFVAVKVFLEKEGKFLVFKDNFGDWDLPGGRIKPEEFETPLEDVIRRKMLQELGGSIKYQIEKPVVFMRHQRTEKAPGTPIVRIFAIGYRAKLLEGDVKLSERHVEMFWADSKTFNPEKYFTGGWLKGVQEYLAIISKS